MDAFRARAARLGFAKVGVAQAVNATGFSRLVEWIDAGFAGEMQYFADRLDAYRHPRGVLEGCQSVICLAYPYPSDTPTPTVPVGRGKVARYAWSGDDYHDQIHPKLKRLCRMLRNWNSESKARGIVDTAPLMEREVAQLAGLGWRGKNTLLLNKQLGSYFFLACVLTDVALPPDEPHVSSHCGTCTACLDACPTDAFPRPGVLDATRCISYLTIEKRCDSESKAEQSIDPNLELGIGDWVFGCDVCQEVCPWNRKPHRRRPGRQTNRQETTSTQSYPMQTLPLDGWAEMTDETFRARYRKTPLWRTRRLGILRSVNIVLRNQKLTNPSVIGRSDPT
ncbi:Epoxyqueuosine reductase [Planctomycetes bacterium CA13]|uniref:Epoxyqueuosine reductase n=2 Tax=Novipirellula herctigrandis TaxID=2527986 RepID=A0A5C5YP35_9BACT|nr:Epoxyqueuosine reductase [Planctomycetes bacterium CA13]